MRSGPSEFSRNGTVWVGPSAGSAAARDRREDRHRVPVLDLGVEGTGEAHVLVVDVDVHEPVQLALLGDQAVLQAGVLSVRSSTSAPRVSPLPSTVLLPPVWVRRMVGIRTS